MNIIDDESKDSRRVIDEINTVIRKFLWLDFQLDGYSYDTLRLIGSVSTSYPPEIQIEFSGVFLYSGVLRWTSNKEDSGIEVVDDEELGLLNERYGVTVGNMAYRIKNSDNLSESILIIAEQVSYRELSDDDKKQWLIKYGMIEKMKK